MIKVFISQPMNGKTNEEIKTKRETAKVLLKTRYNDEVELIDSFFENAPHGANPLWYLGESIKLMSEADIVYFCQGWRDARGCRVEYHCAVAYNKKIIKEAECED